MWIVPLFFAMWLLISLVISYIGGWAKLAGDFKARSAFTGQLWNWQSGSMRWTAHYSRCLTVGCDTRGLYVSVLPIFRFKHPPLFIPWMEISTTRKRILIFEVVEFRLGLKLGIPLQLKASLGTAREKAAGGSWPA